MSLMNRGAALTREHLTNTGQTQADLARKCGVSDVTALNWLRCHMKPKEPRRRIISRWTGGKVPVDAWDQPESAPAADPSTPAAA